MHVTIHSKLGKDRNFVCEGKTVSIREMYTNSYSMMALLRSKFLCPGILLFLATLRDSTVSVSSFCNPYNGVTSYSVLKPPSGLPLFSEPTKQSGRKRVSNQSSVDGFDNEFTGHVKESQQSGSPKILVLNSEQELNALRQQFTEFYQWALKANRPKKVKISTHSAFSTIVTGFFFGAVMPLLSPGFYENGWPRVYDLNSFDNPILAKAIGLMFAISAVTGILRLPRKYLFTHAKEHNVSCLISFSSKFDFLSHDSRIM